MYKKIMVFVVLLNLVMSIVGCGSSDKLFSNLPGDEQESFVWIMAQDIVKGKLKVPGSAKFPSQSSAYIKSTGDNKYQIESYVDAQNSFGAMIRNNFIVELKIDNQYNKEHGGYGYTNLKCDIDE